MSLIVITALDILLTPQSAGIVNGERRDFSSPLEEADSRAADGLSILSCWTSTSIRLISFGSGQAFIPNCTDGARNAIIILQVVMVVAAVVLVVVVVVVVVGSSR